MYLVHLIPSQVLAGGAGVAIVRLHLLASRTYELFRSIFAIGFAKRPQDLPVTVAMGFLTQLKAPKHCQRLGRGGEREDGIF